MKVVILNSFTNIQSWNTQIHTKHFIYRKSRYFSESKIHCLNLEFQYQILSKGNSDDSCIVSNKII